MTSQPLAERVALTPPGMLSCCMEPLLVMVAMPVAGASTHAAEAGACSPAARLLTFTMWSLIAVTLMVWPSAVVTLIASAADAAAVVLQASANAVSSLRYRFMVSSMVVGVFILYAYSSFFVR